VSKSGKKVKQSDSEVGRRGGGTRGGGEKGEKSLRWKMCICQKRKLQATLEGKFGEGGGRVKEAL